MTYTSHYGHPTAHRNAPRPLTAENRATLPIGVVSVHPKRLETRTDASRYPSHTIQRSQTVLAVAAGIAAPFAMVAWIRFAAHVASWL